jgi:gamma-glutamyltranspeptidase/glutathione hydrolase/leukotriene-C4 hydrolase
MTSLEVGEEIRGQINDSRTFAWQHYGGKFNVTEDHGTANFALMDVNGDAVCITSTINL